MAQSKNITVCGGGNGGLAMAADLTLKGFDVSLFELPAYESNIRPIFDRGGIKITGATSSGKTGTVMPKLVTTDPQKAVEDAEIVMLAVPAYGHKAFMETLAPNLRDGQIFVFNTGYWGSLRFKPLLNQLRKDVILVETEILIYLCHAIEPAHICIDATKGEVSFSSMPGKLNGLVHPVLSELYPQFKPANDILEINLRCPNAFFHGPITLLNTGIIEKSGNDPFSFYSDGATPRVCRVIEEVDRERMAIAHALGVKLRTLLQMMSSTYGHVGAAEESIYEALQGMHGNKEGQEIAFNLPASFLFSLAEEDVPYSLIPLVSVAEQLGIEAPTIRAMIKLHSLVNGKDYGTEAVTADTLGFAGMSPDQIRRYVEEGS